MEKETDMFKLNMPFYGAFGSTVVSFLLNLIAFSSPYWLESYPSVHNPFQRMGLWEVCFDRYIHPKDYQVNVYTGCYWIFDWTFIYRGIWEYLDPKWLIAIQVLMGAVLTMQVCCMICMILYFLLYGQPAAESTVTLFGQCASAFLLLICVTVFGVKCQDRQWMPRPDHNHLSWAYGFACLACLACLISAGFLYCVSQSDRALQDECEYYEGLQEAGIQDPGAYEGSVFAPSQSQQPQYQASTGGFHTGYSQGYSNA